MEKKLWCISISQEGAESETIYHAMAADHGEAIALAIEDFVENNGYYQGEREELDRDLDNGYVTTYAFEVTDILK